jgi:cell division transport system permease protein
MADSSKKIIRRRLASSWISTVISISLVLLLIGVGTMLLVNARAVSDYFKEHVQVSVLMKPQVSEEESASLCESLDALPYVKTTRLVSKEEGTAEMARLLGEDFLNVFETAPVPVSIDVTLTPQYVSVDSLDMVVAALGDSPLVEEVVCQTSLVEALNQNLEKISLVLGVLVLLLLFISFVLISNTVRLNVFSRRFTIHTMQLVGATRAFIRRPFVLQSAIQGLFAAFAAILMLLGGLWLLRREFSQLFEIFSFDALLVTMGVIVCSGLIICVLSTVIVVNRLVRFDRDRLYAF